jgi:hypothetical protein
MTPDDLALRITQSASPRFSLDEVSVVIEALASLGYEFVPIGAPGRGAYDSDEQKTHLARWLFQKTSLPLHVARDVLTAVEQYGLRIKEPDAHPSGLKTRCHAYETVRSISRNIYPRMPA